MSAHDSADARTALMATYISRHSYPQAGIKYTLPSSSPSPLRNYDFNAPDRRARKTGPKNTSESLELPEDGSSRFASRGRTIYNAQTTEPVEGVPHTDAYQPNYGTTLNAGSPYHMWIAPLDRPLTALEQLQIIDAQEEWKRSHPFEYFMATGGGFSLKDRDSAEGTSFDVHGTPIRKHTSRDSTPSLSPSSGSESELEFEYTPFMWDAGVMDVDDMRAQEMFDLYIKVEECGGPEYGS